MTQTETLSHPAQALWDKWINPEHTTSDTLERARRTIAGKTAALPLYDLMRAAPFNALSSAVKELHWERMRVVRNGPIAVRDVSDQEFTATDPAQRFSNHERAVDLKEAIETEGVISAEAQKALRYFFVFSILSPGLATWVSELLGQPDVRVTSMEFARYDRNDFIAEHSDVAGQRVANLVMYFEQELPSDGGGTLMVRDRAGQVRSFPPRCNAAVLLPLHPDNVHWVTPWKAGTGRYTVSISFSRETG